MKQLYINGSQLQLQSPHKFNHQNTGLLRSHVLRSRTRALLNEAKQFSLRCYSLYLRGSRGPMNYTTASCLAIDNRTHRSRNNSNKV